MKSGNSRAVAFLLGPLVFGTSLPSSYGAYVIQKGDTLASIALAKYGNVEKWKELYDLNKGQIRDPRFIYPGQRLRLLPEEKLTLVASNDPLPRIAKRSQEWRLLPKQNWERFQFFKPPFIDPTGLDRRSTVGKRFSNQTVPQMTIAPDRIPVSGEITGSRSEYSKLSLGEVTLIRADEPMQVGSIYSITPGPEKLSSARDGRVGFSYEIHGKMKIIGVRDGMFIGTVVALYAPIERGSLLIPDTGTIQIPSSPKECPSPLNATAMIPRFMQLSLVGQAKLIYLDVGTQEGIKPGMIFRHYLNTDPHTGSKFPTRDFMIESEVMVIQAQEQFSTGLILQSRSGIRDEDELVGLIDLKDFDRNQGLQSVIQDHAASSTVDDLDLLDNTEGLGEKEIEELRQLESWSKQIPSEGTGAGIPEEDVQMEMLNSKSSPVSGIGEEPAPNDASGTGTPGAPTSAPPPAPEPTPEPESGNKPQTEPVAPPPSIDSALDEIPITP
ncbi:MAG: LysM peptidoglycan-binding domain-containing protein [Bdellovibrionales bacterium]|nr:LysM peptidoglycan-binding domain-containing protein [Bdellovibrionales bacterium]